MRTWVRRVRAALVMGLVWAAVWAPVGVLVGTIIDPDGSRDEPWILIGAYPGFLSGVVFSVVLGVLARRRRLEELSVPRFAAWGALAGALVGSLPFTIGTSTSRVPLWLLGGVVVGSITLLGSASAAASLVLARRAARRELPDAGADTIGLEAPEEEAPRELPEGSADLFRREPLRPSAGRNRP